MNYSKDIQRRRRWFRLNYTLILSAVFLTIIGVSVGDWHPVPAAKYAEHATDYLRVQQKMLAQPNVLTNTSWVRGGSPEATVTLNDSESIDGIRVYRLSASFNADTNVSASIASSPVSVASGKTYMYQDAYLSTVENQLEVEEFNAKQESVGKQYLSRYPVATATTHYAAHFTVSPQTTTVILRRYIDQNGKLSIESQSLRQSPVAGFSEGMVTIAFDESLVAAGDFAQQEMKKYGFNGTYYTVSNSIGKPGFLTASQLKALYESGNEIGSLTQNHRDLLGISNEEKDAEIARSRESLASLGLGEVINFAAPYGKHDADTRNIARRYYRSLRSLEEQTINYPYNYDPFSVKAFVVDTKTDPARIASLVDQVKKTGGWLVLVYHDFGGASDWTYRIQPEAFSDHMQTIAKSGVQVKTMQAALDTAEAYFKGQP